MSCICAGPALPPAGARHAHELVSRASQRNRRAGVLLSSQTSAQYPNAVAFAACSAMHIIAAVAAAVYMKEKKG